MTKTVLAIAAHPDDVEILCSGTLSLLGEQGYELHVATMSLGDCGTLDRSPREIRLIRRREARAACAVLRAQYHYVGFRDFQIFNDDPSNRRVTALIRDVDPEVVITHSPQDYMSDHEATSRLVRNACFYAPAPNYDTLAWSAADPSSGIPFLYYAHPLDGVDIFGAEVAAQFYVDVSPCIETKTQMLACHESQRAWLRNHHGMDEYIEGMLNWSRALGRRATRLVKHRVTYAEAFRQHLGHAYPSENRLQQVLQERVVSTRERSAETVGLKTATHRGS